MNFDEIVVKESPGICRCCLSEGCYKDLGTEYTWMNETEVYADMLLDCFDISITQHNDGPNGAKRLICEVCITRLRDACNFKKQVVDSERRFIDMLGRGEFKTKVLTYQSSRELKEEAADETPEDVMAEDVEYLEDVDIDYDGEEEEIKTELLQSTSAASSSERPRLKRGRPRKVDDKPDKAKKQKVAKGRSSELSGAADTMRTNLKILFNHTTIMPFKWKMNYTCYYCHEAYPEYANLRNHTKSHNPCTKNTLRHVKAYTKVLIDVSEIICRLCQTEFQSRTVVVDHLIDSHCKVYNKNVIVPFQEYRLRDLRCLLCDQHFSTFQILARHVHCTHSDSKKKRFVCNECGKCFTTASDISLHIQTEHVVSSFACIECSKQFTDEAQLKKHDLIAHLHKCLQCDAKFKNANSLKTHTGREHLDDKCTKCKYCSKEIPLMKMKFHSFTCEFKEQVGMNIDSQYSHQRFKRNALCNQIRRNIQCVLNMSTAVPFKFKGKFSCFYCSQWFSHFDDLISHTRTEHPVCELKSKAMQTCKGEKARIKLDVNNLTCKLCLQSMLDLKSFIDHVIAEHGAEYDKSVPFKDCFEAFQLIQGKIPCPECQKPFAYFATLLKHLGSEHNHHKAVCAYCGRGFRTTTSLAMHISNSHTGTCECSVCNVKCKNSASLARHMARFHDAKNFKCPECPELFETIYKKQNHLIKAHNIGHKCAYCGKMFTRNSFMMNHVRRTHLKERTVPCSVCQVKFFDNYHMKLHMVKHEGMRRYRCDLCGKSFLRVRNLKSHMDTHKKGYL